MAAVAKTRISVVDFDFVGCRFGWEVGDLVLAASAEATAGGAATACGAGTSRAGGAAGAFRGRGDPRGTSFGGTITAGTIPGGTFPGGVGSSAILLGRT